MEKKEMKRQRDSFLTPLVVQVMPTGKRFKLHHDFVYHYKPLNVRIRARAGFVTDFASIPVSILLANATLCIVVAYYLTLPWLLWIGVLIVILGALVPKIGLQNKAAVIHDALYQGMVTGDTTSRKMADRIFREGMKDLGVAPWKYWLMWLAVRVGGWMAWRKR